MLLLTGRTMHGLNFSFGLDRMGLRVGGMMLTLTAMALGAVICVL